MQRTGPHMLEMTSQERLALVTLALLLAGGAAARQLAARADAANPIEITAEAGDSLSPGRSSALRERVEGELTESRRRSEPLDAGERIDPNTADAIQLDRLPGIGPAMADRIVAHRAASGRFTTADDLSAVSGIGPALLERIAPHLTLGRGVESRATGGGSGGSSGASGVGSGARPARSSGRPGAATSGTAGSRSHATTRVAGSRAESAGGGARSSPVVINRATADELQELPGVGPAIAARIVEHREGNGPFRSWEELENVSGIGPRLRERIQAVARLGP